MNTIKNIKEICHSFIKIEYNHQNIEKSELTLKMILRVFE